MKRLRAKCVIAKAILIIMVATSVVIKPFAVDVSAATVSVKNGTATVNTAAVMRTSASTSSKAKTTIAKGKKVTILEEKFVAKSSTASTKKWYKISYGGYTGYVRSDLVSGLSYGSVTGKVKGNVNYRRGAGTGMKKVGTFKKGKTLTILAKARDYKSSLVWYRIKEGGKTYYVSSRYVQLTGTTATSTSTTAGTSATSGSTDAAFETYMKKQGFPDSYKPALRKLHKAHPNWAFIANNTGINFATAAAKESKSGVSLINIVYPLRYRDSATKYVPKDGLVWFNANSEVVKYYMDPRNFLNEDRIYMFENLRYHSYQSNYAVSKVLSGTALSRNGYTAAMFVNAGKTYNISPIHLAARARQEVGGGSVACSGYKISGVVYYNPFNIGATSSINPVLKGMNYAKSAGWNTKTKAVNGGASFLSNGYLKNNQHTMYYQKFNVANGLAKVATHQYMTNIMAAYNEALTTKNAYTTYGITGESLVFEIPVYTNMPSKTSLP